MNLFCPFGAAVIKPHHISFWWLLWCSASLFVVQTSESEAILDTTLWLIIFMIRHLSSECCSFEAQHQLHRYPWGNLVCTQGLHTVGNKLPEKAWYQKQTSELHCCCEMFLHYYKWIWQIRFSGPTLIMNISNPGDRYLEATYICD